MGTCRPQFLRTGALTTVLFTCIQANHQLLALWLLIQTSSRVLGSTTRTKLEGAARLRQRADFNSHCPQCPRSRAIRQLGCQRTPLAIVCLSRRPRRPGRRLCRSRTHRGRSRSPDLGELSQGEGQRSLWPTEERFDGETLRT